MNDDQIDVTLDQAAGHDVKTTIRNSRENANCGLCSILEPRKSSVGRGIASEEVTRW